MRKVKYYCDLCGKEIAEEYVIDEELTEKRKLHIGEQSYAICDDCYKIIVKTMKAIHSKDANIEELDLSIRAYNLLARANIQTIEELQGKTKSEMMSVRNMGLKSLREIEEKLIKVTGSGFADEREENENRSTESTE